MQQVADWLEKLGLGQYAQRFAENDISFSILPDLTDQHLEKIGVASLGHRLQLLRAIAELTSREKEAPKPAGPTTAAIASPTVTPSAEATAERRQGQQLGPLCGCYGVTARTPFQAHRAPAQQGVSPTRRWRGHRWRSLGPNNVSHSTISRLEA
jgi:hypothetical protein